MTAPTMTEAQWIRKVRQTRSYGSCYIPVASRDGMAVQGITYTWTPYGRSALAGGHKHKAYAHDSEGKPVPSKDLRPRQTANGF